VFLYYILTSHNLTVPVSYHELNAGYHVEENWIPMRFKKEVVSAVGFEPAIKGL